MTDIERTTHSDNGCSSDFCLIQMPKAGEMHTNSGKCYCSQLAVKRKMDRLEARVRRLEGALDQFLRHSCACDCYGCEGTDQTREIAREALKGETKNASNS